MTARDVVVAALLGPWWISTYGATVAVGMVVAPGWTPRTRRAV